jgi:hypothetical protein
MHGTLTLGDTFDFVRVGIDSILFEGRYVLAVKLEIRKTSRTWNAFPDEPGFKVDDSVPVYGC